MLQKLEDRFSIVENLRASQQSGWIGNRKLTKAAEAALGLMQQEADTVWGNSPQRKELAQAFEILCRKLLGQIEQEKLKNIINRAHCPKTNTISGSCADQLKTDAHEIASSMLRDSSLLSCTGLTGDRVGLALLRLEPKEIGSIFSDPIFYSGGNLDLSKVDAFLYYSDSRGLFDRIKKFYSDSALSEITFLNVVNLVNNPELANAKIDLASECISSGLTKAMVFEYATRSDEERAWFNSVKELPGYRDCPFILLRLSKLPEEKRREAITIVDQLVIQGSSVSEAIHTFIKAQKNPKILDNFKRALSLDMSAAAAGEFAGAEITLRIPNLAFDKLQQLRSLAHKLSWTDHSCVRYVTGEARPLKSDKNASIFSRKDLIDGLRSNMDHSLLVDPKSTDTLRYKVRLMLSKLTFDEIIQLYSCFFPNPEVTALKDRLIKASQADKVGYHTTVNGDGKWFKAEIPDLKRIRDGDFQKLISKLSIYLLSPHDFVKGTMQQHLHKWLTAYSRKSYEQYYLRSPDVVGLLIDQTIRGFDPYKNAKVNHDIMTAFANSMKHFWTSLVRYELGADRQALAAHKIFVVAYSNSKKRGIDDPALVWSQQKELREDLSEAFDRARSKWEEIRNQQKS